MTLCTVHRMALATAILLLSANSVHAQGMGSIFGRATDTSGAIMPGVTVTATGTALQQPRVTVTSQSGAYQMPNIPIGTYTVTFELTGFKKVTRSNVIVTDGFNAQIDAKLDIGQMTEEVTVSGASPVVDVKRTTTGATFDATTLQNIPTSRDPWQIINMTPGVTAGLNIGGSSSGQQVGLDSRGTGANVQWNLEGGSITDLSSNSSPSYYNFDSFEQIQVVNGGGDVSIQSSGISINLVTKSGSNTFKGSAVGTFENDAMQFNNVTPELFDLGEGGLLSGAPLKRVSNVSAEFGGPIVRNRLWFWGATDWQDINAGVVNFFDPNAGSDCAAFADAQRLGTLSSSIAFDQLQRVQECLHNDKTTIKTWSGKVNFQLNTGNSFQFLMQADDKRRNARGASANTAIEAASQQYGGSKWFDKITPPTRSFTHTWVANNRLVFTNQYTYVPGGFSLDYQDYQTCGESNYIDRASDAAAYTTGPRSSPDCLWNIQPLLIRTTGYQSRGKTSTYQTERKTHEIKTDATYFLSNKLGGDHSLKFGVGYRKAPIMSFSHYSGGGRAQLQCMNNNEDLCGPNRVAPGSGQAGLVPYRAELWRDQLRNNDWWTWSGYIQDSFSTGRFRINAGLRYDWQHSKYLGGCVPANVIRPDLLPAQCEDATQSGINPNTGEEIEIQPFSNWAPRMSVTYDLFGTGKTALKVAGSYYYDTRFTLADDLGGLFTVTRLRWTNNSSGTCPSSNCWTDANNDGVIQANELIGTPAVSSSRFDRATGVLTPEGSIVDPDTKLERTREVVTGVQHELISNLAVGVDYIFRRYDRGPETFDLGYQPGAPGYPLQNLYTGPLTWTDPTTGISAPYFVIREGVSQPSGVGEITVTSPSYQDYHGVDLTLNKRYSNRWQAAVAVTLQTNPVYGNASRTNPTENAFRHGFSTEPGYIIKASGSYEFPWRIMASGNFNMNQGAVRVLEIDGPGDVYGGPDDEITYDTLEFQAVNSERFDAAPVLDLAVHKTFRLRSERYQLRLMFDMFNILNTNTILDYRSDNLSRSTSLSPEDILPPRVFRVGARIQF